MTSCGTWTPIAFQAGSILDGAGYRIFNLKIATAGGTIGFFSTSAGTIQNLEITQSLITAQTGGTTAFGIFVGELDTGKKKMNLKIVYQRIRGLIF
jgi:hypothetical protein